MKLLTKALMEGKFSSYDYNGQECGFYKGPRLLAARPGDKIKFGARPHSTRECLSGEIEVEVIKVILKEDTKIYLISVQDDLGSIGGYPNYERYQENDWTGFYQVTVTPTAVIRPVNDLP